MKPAKVDELDCIQFLTIAQQVFIVTKMAWVQAEKPNTLAHNTYTCLLKRIPPDVESLWWKVFSFVKQHWFYMPEGESSGVGGRQLQEPFHIRVGDSLTQANGALERIQLGEGVQNGDPRWSRGIQSY